MTPYQKRTTAVTKRMAGDMKIRHLAQATIDAYTYHVGKFHEFIRQPIDQVLPEDIRNFQLYGIEERKLGWSSFNQAVCSLRFLYTVTIPKSWPVTMIPFGKRAKRLPTVLSREEVDAPLSPTACEFGPFDVPPDASDEDSLGASPCCPSCGGKMILQGEREKPSWREVMDSPSCPSWYRVPGGEKDLPSRATRA